MFFKVVGSFLLALTFFGADAQAPENSAEKLTAAEYTTQDIPGQYSVAFDIPGQY